MTTNNTPGIAETFIVPQSFNQGCMITSIDIALANIDANYPIEVRIVETLNGYPTQNILSNARSVLYSYNVSKEINTANYYNFKFQKLVSLSPNTEYAIVILSNSFSSDINPNTSAAKVWIAEIGQAQIGSTGNLITSQPSLGSLFQSQNGSTWIADQNASLSFILNRAQFDTSVKGNISLVDAPIAASTLLTPNPFKTAQSSISVKVHHINHGLTSNMVITYNNSTDTRFNTTFQVDRIINSDYYLIDLIGLPVSTVSSNVGGNKITVEKNIRYNCIYLPNTKNVPSLTTTFSSTTTDEYGTMTTSNLKSGPNYLPTKYVFSSDNKNDIINNKNSFEFNINIGSSNDAISPVIDLSYLPIKVYGNRISNSISTSLSPIVDRIVITSNASVFTSDGVITVPIDTNFDQIILGAKLTIIDSDISPGVSNNSKYGFISNIDPVGYTITISSTSSPITNTTGRSATLRQFSTYISETQNNGYSDSKHITVPVSLSKINSNFRCMVSFNILPNTNIELYYRTTLSSSNVKLSDASWSNFPISYNTSATNDIFIDYEFDITNIQSFDQFQFKFVFLSSDNSVAPSIKNLRIISYA